MMSYDFLISDDPHDLDIAVITDVDQPVLRRSWDGNRRRIDTLLIPANLPVEANVSNGNESYQPISYILLTHAMALTPAAQTLVRQLADRVEVKSVAQHYLDLSPRFLRDADWALSYAHRRDTSLPVIKKIVPLHRVVRDLWPRAYWLATQGTWCGGRQERELLAFAGVEKADEQLKRWFAQPDKIDWLEVATLVEKTHSDIVAFKDHYGIM